MNVLEISHPFLIHFECSWALFKAGGYRNAYPYPYPSLPIVLTCAGLKTRGIHYLLLPRLLLLLLPLLPLLQQVLDLVYGRIFMLAVAVVGSWAF